ncbi:ABC transporter permease [Paenibacillus caseinilyticus]|uniref:ABC transporter permease n=1 Tax=Paenibacillus mucilaginosus K02 TaxID=997761 RepID=I0BBJ3_9BACL|nr:ABC transporter permease [Paenibacillus mucilaginosus]AFH59740.1 ABC transporter permease [Paenibacillus mucilaginosus K02]
MRAYIQLTLAQLRLFSRNRQVLIWSLAFPVFFMVMLGTFLGKGNPVSVNGAVVDLDRTLASQKLVTALRESPVLKLKEGGAVEAELDALKKGDNQLVIVIPQGYAMAVGAAATSVDLPEEPVSSERGSKIKLEDGTVATVSSSQVTTLIIREEGAPFPLKVYYDETNATVSTVGLQLLGPIVDGIDKELSGYKPRLALEPEGVQALKLAYIDFLVPGILAMMIMSNNLNGVAGQIASWRERGILRRMQSTPLRASTFIAAQITARLLMNGAQALIVLLVGALAFGTQVRGSWLLLLGFVVLGTLAFMSIGFIIAGLAKTPESAGPLAGVISFPLLFLGGVFFPIGSMPGIVQSIVKLLPIAHLTTALRQVMNVGAGLDTLWGEALLLGGWMAAAFLLASFTFKWE